MQSLRTAILLCLCCAYGIVCQAQRAEQAYITVNQDSFHYQSLRPLLPYLDKIHSLAIVDYDLQGAFDTLYRFDQLRELNIFGCEYDSLPAGIGNLRKLEVLRLDYTDIHSLPDDFRKLSKLQQLFINKHDCFPNCQFTVPAWIDELESLKKIRFKDCNIPELPESFFRLRRLESFWLVHGNFEAFPEGLLGMESLKSITYIYGGGACPEVEEGDFEQFECVE